MKKSGARWRAPASLRGASLEVCIAPLLYEIAIEVLAERLDLSLEAPAKLERERVVGRTRAGSLRAVVRRQRAPAKPLRGDRLDRGLQRARRGAAPEVQRAHEPVKLRRADSHRRVHLDRVGLRLGVDAEEVEHARDRADVVGAI